MTPEKDKEYRKLIAGGGRLCVTSSGSATKVIEEYPFMEGHVEVVSEEEMARLKMKKKLSGRLGKVMLSAMAMSSVINADFDTIEDKINRTCPVCSAVYKRVKGDKYTHCSPECYKKSKKSRR